MNIHFYASVLLALIILILSSYVFIDLKIYSTEKSKDIDVVEIKEKEETT